jgi:primosomal protein N' (replication factor Y) (superfamily II helicase)
MFAEIVVNLPIEGAFHYHIPPELAGRLVVGHLVEVSFGRQLAQGIVLALSHTAPVETTKPVLRLIDRDPVVSAVQLDLARWMSQTYLASLAECVRLLIPPGLSKRGDQIIRLTEPSTTPEGLSAPQTRLVRLLQERGPLRARQIARALPRRNWQEALRQLKDQGLVIQEPVLDPPSVHSKKVKLVELAIPPERVAGGDAAPVRPTKIEARRQAVLRVLAQSAGPTAASQIYTAVEGSTLADLKALEEDDLVILHEDEVWRDPLKDLTFISEKPPELTPDQAAAWETIQEALAQPEPTPILVHGVTGSGKTELYLRAVDAVLKQGRQAIVLVPEIALTPQTIRRFGARFPGRIGLLHSRLSDGERYDTWRRARNRQIDLVIGPRSALFVPFRDVGLIAIDECHDDSYKQSPPVEPPSYHTLPTAIKLARLHRGLVLMGSATPAVTTYAAAAQGKSIRLIRLPGRIMGHRRAIEVQAIHYHIHETRYTHLAAHPDEAVMIDLPPVQVVDMRQELRADNRSIFSRALSHALTAVLSRGEQAILFLNRRGSASYVFCRDCGHVLSCPRCDTPLTWHQYRDQKNTDQDILVCHHCDYRTRQPETCPACGSAHIRYFGSGTERVEQNLRELFPDAVPLRWDRDTTQGKDAHFALLQQFASRQANVLIGTQMIAKGLDLPMVTLVGVINADTALHLPDYRSAERTFQLLTQVGGRAGRGLLGGEVIIQTYAPEHYAIRAAAEHDFDGFYAEEIKHRRELGYPPFSRLVRLIVRAETPTRAGQEAERLHKRLQDSIAEKQATNLSLIGPATCFYPRRDNLYRWHIIVRGANPTRVLDGLHSGQFLQIDVDPVSLL